MCLFSPVLFPNMARSKALKIRLINRNRFLHFQLLRRLDFEIFCGNQMTELRIEDSLVSGSDPYITGFKMAAFHRFPEVLTVLCSHFAQRETFFFFWDVFSMTTGWYAGLVGGVGQNHCHCYILKEI